MTDHPEKEASMSWLRVVAWVQGAVIAVLAFLVARGSDFAPPQVGEPTEAASTKTETAADPAAVAPGPATVVPHPDDTAAAPAPPQSPVPEGTLLYGRLVDEAGEPVRDAYAWFTREGETKELARVNTQRDAAFAIAGLAPGKVEVRTRATGFRELRDTIEIPADSPPMRHDIVLQKSWNLLVKILTPDGKPASQALQELQNERKGMFWAQVDALATPWQPSGDFPPTNLREADYGVGRWRSATGIGAMRDGPKLGKEFAGAIELDTRQSLWVSAVMRHHVLATTRVEPGQGEVTLTVALAQVLQSLGTIRLRVIDGSTGTPVTDARVSFSDIQSSGAGSMVDAQGKIEVRDLRPGLLRMSIGAKDRSGPNAEVMLEPGQTLDLGDVPLVANRQIKGRCDNREGKGDRLSIQATSLETPMNPSLRPQSHRAQVAEDGTFTLRLPDGRYFVRATGAGGAAAEIDTRTLGDEPLVLRLDKEASIRLEANTGGELLELAVIGSNGRTVFRRWVKDGWKFPVQCLPGDYRIEVKDRAGKVSTRQLHVGPEGVDLRVP